MNDSKLIEMLRTLTPEEFRDFGRFVYSPFFNRLNNVTKFYDELKKHYPRFSSRNLTEEKTFYKIFPNEEFNYSKMKLVESDLLILARKYLTYIAFSESPNESDRFLLLELRKRKLTRLFENSYKAANKSLNSIKFKDESYYFNKFFVENQYILNITNSKLFYDQSVLQRQLDYFIDFFLIQVLRLYSFMVYQEKYLFDFKFSLTFLDEVINYVNKNADKIDPLALLQFNDVMLTLKGEEHYYNELKELTHKYSDRVDFNELYNIYATLSRYMNEKFDENSNKYIDEIFELYKTILRIGIFKSHFHMNNNFFIKTIDLSLRKKEYLFLEKFIEEYGVKLSPEHKSDTLNYCEALRNYYEKDFDKALDKLSAVGTQDYNYKLNIKSLSIRIFYEKDSMDAFESQADTFRHFILNNKLVPDVIKNDYLNFINFASRLHRARISFQYEDIDMMKNEIIKRKDVALKYWLLEKIEEFDYKKGR